MPFLGLLSDYATEQPCSDGTDQCIVSIAAALRAANTGGTVTNSQGVSRRVFCPPTPPPFFGCDCVTTERGTCVEPTKKSHRTLALAALAALPLPFAVSLCPLLPHLKLRAIGQSSARTPAACFSRRHGQHATFQRALDPTCTAPPLPPSPSALKGSVFVCHHPLQVEVNSLKRGGILPALAVARVRAMGRSIPPKWGPTRLRSAPRTYDAPPCGVRAVPDRLTKSRKHPPDKYYRSASRAQACDVIVLALGIDKSQVGRAQQRPADGVCTASRGLRRVRRAACGVRAVWELSSRCRCCHSPQHRGRRFHARAKLLIQGVVFGNWRR